VKARLRIHTVRVYQDESHWPWRRHFGHCNTCGWRSKSFRRRMTAEAEALTHELQTGRPVELDEHGRLPRPTRRT
jgi:hypothetical protein